MTTEAFSVRTEQEKLKQIDTIAKAMDRSRNYIVNEALEGYLAWHADFVEKVMRGIEQADRGEGVPHDEVFDRLEARIQAKIDARS